MQWLTLPLGLTLALATAASADVRVRIAGDAAGEPIVLLVRGDEGERTVRTTIGAEIEVARPGTVVASGEWWSPAVALSDAPVIELPVWRAAELTGRLRTEKGVDRPRQLEAAFEVERGSARQRVTTTCPVDGDGAWRCRLPESQLDVRLSAGDFAPQYLWDVELSRERARSVPPFVLKRGGSVAGWVDTAGGVTDGAIVRLAPVVYGAPSEEARLQTFERKANRRGFYQFMGVPAGSWVVNAEAAGFSPSTIIEVQVDDRNESVVRDALMLRELVDVQLRITPRRYAPGRPWKVRLHQQSTGTPSGKRVAESDAADDGTWRHPDAAIGDYRLSIVAPSGAVLAQKQFVVQAGMPPIEIAIDAVPVIGRVRVGGTGVAARVKLSTYSGQHVTVTSDAGGDFKAMLPSEGAWNADVRLLASGQELRLDEVDVRRAEGGDARVELDFPGGRIAGRVVDEAGKPARRAGIVVTRSGSPVADVVSDDGTFEIVGLPLGPAQIEASANELHSGGVALTVSEQSAPVTLVVRGMTVVEGWLGTPAGQPVAGAAIRYSTPAQWYLKEVVSSPTGRFTLDLDPGATLVTLAVVAVDHPAKLVQVAIPERGRRLDLTLGTTSGRLIVPIRSRDWPSLRRGGALASLRELVPPFYAAGSRRWATSEGLALDLEPGEYALCATRDPSSRCVAQVVRAGTTVVAETP